jgi:hypothetical protein
MAKECYMIVASVGNLFLKNPFLDSTNINNVMRIRWYVPCSVKYPRWSSIFRILSVELWLVLTISIVTAAISTTFVGRYSGTPEWHRYMKLTSSLTKLWAVILVVSVSTMPRTPSLHSLFLAWMCFPVSFSAVFQAFLTTFLIDSGYKTPIKNMDVIFASGIKLAYPPEYSFIFVNGDETESSQLQRNRMNSPSLEVCVDLAEYQKNALILLLGKFAEES